MANPWDVPFPTRGDATEKLTHQGVGRVLSIWEMCELELARIYSAFVGDPDGRVTVDDYGQEIIFARRLFKLRASFAAYAMRYPNQDLEGPFVRISIAAERFADRRNEVAHGYVLSVEQIGYFRQVISMRKGQRHHYLLIPPLYTVKKHQQGLPNYAYSYAELMLLSRGLEQLLVASGEYRSRLSGA